jgi:hypothetical protein
MLWENKSTSINTYVYRKKYKFYTARLRIYGVCSKSKAILKVFLDKPELVAR